MASTTKSLQEAARAVLENALPLSHELVEQVRVDVRVLDSLRAALAASKASPTREELAEALRQILVDAEHPEHPCFQAACEEARALLARLDGVKL